MGSRSRAEHNGKIIDSVYSVEALPATYPTLTHPILGDAPDGGTLAWLQVAGSFFVLMNTWCVPSHIPYVALTSSISGASSILSVHIKTSMKSTFSVHTHPPRSPGLALSRVSSSYSLALSPAPSSMQGTTARSSQSAPFSLFLASR
jgi:hypothetical protein